METVKPDQSGFTLIEIIVGITVSAILAVILSQIVSGMSLRSYWPVQQVDEKLLLQAAMSDLSAEHRRLLMEDPAPLDGLQTYIANLNDAFAGRVTASVECVEFDPLHRTEQPRPTCGDVDKIWKVTLVGDGGQRLIALFTR